MMDKKTLINISICLSVFACMLASDVQAGNILLTKYQNKEGQPLAFFADSGKLNKCPKWNGKEDIPLEPQKAVSIAKEWLLHRTKDKEIPSVNSISIQMAGEIENCWFYTIFFVTFHKDNNGSILPLSSAVVVLLDGSVVEPVVEKGNILSVTGGANKER